MSINRAKYAKENKKLREVLKIVQSKVGSIVDNLTKKEEEDSDLENLGKKILDLGQFCKKFKFKK